MGAISDVISPERRDRAVGALLAVGQLASVVSLPALPCWLTGGGWRFTFIAWGLLSASGLVANWFLFPRDSRERVRDVVIFSRYWSLIVLGFFQVALTVNLAHRLVFWAMVSFFVAYMIHIYGVSLRFVSLPLAIIAIGQVIGSSQAELWRGREVVEEVMGDEFEGVLVSDFYGAYNVHQGLHQ